MLFVISPAKTLDLTPAPAALADSRPELAADAKKLASVMRGLKAVDLRRLMDISEPLAALNARRYQEFRPKGRPEDLPAALMFAGDVYAGLRARDLSSEDLEWAQERVRILSGLYGVLRPLDRIQPYRLEMGVRLQTERGATLYDFWGDKISKALNRAAQGHVDPTVVNLASQEYFGGVDARALKLPVLSVSFREEKDGESRVLSLFAKKARGLMTRYAIENRLEKREDLKGFDLEGYRFDRVASGPQNWVFTRPQPAPKGAPTQRPLETFA